MPRPSIRGQQRRVRSWAALCVALAVIAALAGRAPVEARASAGLPRLSHVVVVVMENEELHSVLGNRQAPYVNRLARRAALAGESFAITHPSLPNYLALTGGSTFGISSDCTDCSVAAPNLIDELETAGISWKAYMEDMPSPCFTGAEAGRYAKKHDPFMYYQDITSDPARCSRVVPGTQLDRDLSTGALPQFAWVTPNLCNDMHDCGVPAGDRYLAREMPRLLAGVGPTGAVFLTWDEGSSGAGCCGGASGGHVVTILAGGAARPRARSTIRYDHYSLLRTIEDSWSLPELGRAACACTVPMTALLRHSQ